MGESFDAIVGYQSNGAIVHYKPEPESCAMIRNEGILLVDCGGQYLGGTTDITRTIALSTPTDLQRKDFTLVLKGVLALSMAHFPKGANGIQMDTMARQYLWRHARNYGHGTGHGVGYFLNVHEGPHGFSPVVGERTRTPIEPGTITSNEPGLYRTGQYGIRTENLILCVVDETNDFGSFLKFETLTLFPIDLSLIDVTMLDSEEKNWLNDYHRTVFERLSALLDQSEIAWLREKCRPI
jgi:Xaa-Pro aminopeptidase